MSWHGPYQIRNILEKAIDDDRDTPAENDGVYVITQERWHGKPTQDAGVLYVGGNTGKSKRFRTRIGDLIADMLGFFCDETGHHSGGQSLYKWCHQERVNPLDLYIGWQTEVSCPRCAENNAYEKLSPLLNRKQPPRCQQHA